jgi:hypothetical protein
VVQWFYDPIGAYFGLTVLESGEKLFYKCSKKKVTETVIGDRTCEGDGFPPGPCSNNGIVPLDVSYDADDNIIPKEEPSLKASDKELLDMEG